MVIMELDIIVDNNKINDFLKKLELIGKKYSCKVINKIGIINSNNSNIKVKVETTQFTFTRNNTMEDLYNDILYWDKF